MNTKEHGGTPRGPRAERRDLKRATANHLCALRDEICNYMKFEQDYEQDDKPRICLPYITYSRKMPFPHPMGEMSVYPAWNGIYVYLTNNGTRAELHYSFCTPTKVYTGYIGSNAHKREKGAPIVTEDFEERIDKMREHARLCMLSEEEFLKKLGKEEYIEALAL